MQAATELRAKARGESDRGDSNIGILLLDGL